MRSIGNKSVDWARIRVEYETETKSIRQVAEAHGVSDTAIRLKAKAEGWEREASAKSVRAISDSKDSENGQPNWKKIKAQVLAGTKSIRQIARAHGVSDTAIRKRAKKEGWTVKPDGPKGAKSKGRELPREPSRALTVVPRKAQADIGIDPIFTKAAEAKPEEMVKEGLEALRTLLAMLKLEMANPDWLRETIEEMTDNDDSPRRFQALMKLVQVPVLMLACKNYTLALDTLIGAGPGKKEKAQEDAKNAGVGTDWGDDLNLGGFGAN